MQQVLFQQNDFTRPESRAYRNMPGHGTGLQPKAANDDCYVDEDNPIRLGFSVVGNVIGGALLLSVLLLLPQIVAIMLG